MGLSGRMVIAAGLLLFSSGCVLWPGKTTPKEISPKHYHFSMPVSESSRAERDLLRELYRREAEEILPSPLARVIGRQLSEDLAITMPGLKKKKITLLPGEGCQAECDADLDEKEVRTVMQSRALVLQLSRHPLLLKTMPPSLAEAIHPSLLAEVVRERFLKACQEKGYGLTEEVTPPRTVFFPMFEIVKEDVIDDLENYSIEMRIYVVEKNGRVSADPVADDAFYRWTHFEIQKDRLYVAPEGLLQEDFLKKCFEATEAAMLRYRFDNPALERALIGDAPAETPPVKKP